MPISAASVTPAAGPVLVAGATGALGGRVVRRLLAEGYAVRAVGRNDAAMAPLAAAGATVVRADLRDAVAITVACEGVSQVVSTANNVMGAGATSPNRVDVPAYRTLCQAMREQRVGRIVHVSALGIAADSPVDYFRVKHQVDALLEASGVPYVLVQPSAFMETWVTLLIGDGIRTKQTATLFGDGRRVSNFIAMDDVAAFVCRIVADPTVRNERIHLGGPSTLSYEQVAVLLERALGITARRTHVPVPVMGIGRMLVRPFNEVAARMMSLGYWSATRDNRCDDWEVAARRFGVMPRTVEAYIAETVGAP
jgi:uncharacterized protein YbjT (DUF2867 family)